MTGAAMSWLNVCSWLWCLWALYWWRAARDVARAESVESQASRLLHIVPTALSFLAIFAPLKGLPVHARLFAEGGLCGPLGAALTAAGLLYAVWARVHLGRNWSALVTLKEGHRLIRTGPYALTRHPIYTGYLAAFLGSAAALGEWRGAAASAVMLLTYWRKLRVEEGVMLSHFGADYDAYRASVKALVPFIL